MKISEMSVYAIGDIHGYSLVLKNLIEQVQPRLEDTLVFLGDYVDKGPDVAGVLDYLCELEKKLHCFFLRGNHDQLLLNAIASDQAYSPWRWVAGDTPLSSYGEGDEREVLKLIPECHVDFLQHSCKLYWENEEFIFVHGGISPFTEPVEEDEHRLMSAVLRDAQPHCSGKTVVCGHSTQASGKIADRGHTICIDTGISKGMYLTCLNLDDLSYTQISEKFCVQRGRLRE